LKWVANPQLDSYYDLCRGSQQLHSFDEIQLDILEITQKKCKIWRTLVTHWQIKSTNQHAKFYWNPTETFQVIVLTQLWHLHKDSKIQLSTPDYDEAMADLKSTSWSSSCQQQSSPCLAGDSFLIWENKKAQLSLTNPRDAKACQNCSDSTSLPRCRRQYWPIFIRLAVVASKICEIPRNSLKIQTHRVQGHPTSSILVSMESPYVTSY